MPPVRRDSVRSPGSPRGGRLPLEGATKLATSDSEGIAHQPKPLESLALQHRAEAHPAVEREDGSLQPYAYRTTRTGRLAFCGSDSADCVSSLCTKPGARSPLHSDLSPLGSGVAFFFKHLKAMALICALSSLFAIPNAVIFYQAAYYPLVYGEENSPRLARLSIGDLGYSVSAEMAWTVAALDAMSAAILLVGVLWMTRSEATEELNHRLTHVTADAFSVCLRGLPADTTAGELHTFINQHLLRSRAHKVHAVVLVHDYRSVLALSNEREHLVAQVEDVEMELVEVYAAAGLSVHLLQAPKTTFVADAATYKLAMARQAAAEAETSYDDADSSDSSESNVNRNPRSSAGSRNSRQKPGGRPVISLSSLSFRAADVTRLPLAKQAAVAALWGRRKTLLARARAYQRRILLRNIEAPIVAAFVTFESRRASTGAMAALHRGWVSVLTCGLFSPGLPRLRGAHLLTVEPAPRPSDVLFENLGYSWLQRWTRIALAELAGLGLLLVSMGIFIASREIQEKSVYRETASSILPFFVAALNLMINAVVRNLSALIEKHHSIDEQESFIFVRLFLRQAFNSSLFILLLNSDWRVNVPGVRGRFTDMDASWCSAVGSSLVAVQILNLVTPHIEKTFRAMRQRIRIRQWRAGRLKIATQRRLNALFTGPMLKLSEKYAAQVSIAFACIAFSTSLPVLLAVATAVFVVSGQVELHAVCNLYRAPPAYGLATARSVNRILLVAVAGKLLLGLWSLTTVSFPRFSPKLDSMWSGVEVDGGSTSFVYRVVREYCLPHLALLSIVLLVSLSDIFFAFFFRIVLLLRCETVAIATRHALSRRVMPVPQAAGAHKLASHSSSSTDGRRGVHADEDDNGNLDSLKPAERLQRILSNFSAALNGGYIADLPSFEPAENPFYRASFAIETASGGAGKTQSQAEITQLLADAGLNEAAVDLELDDAERASTLRGWTVLQCRRHVWGCKRRIAV
jgi:hypothetical protein